MTTTLQVAGFYVAVNALISLLLAINVVRHRARTRAVIGDGGDEKLRLAQRAHANNVEYVPIMLVMLVMLAMMQTATLTLHILGAVLAVARIAHGYGITRSATDTNVFRAGGAMATWILMLVMIVLLLIKAFS